MNLATAIATSRLAAQQREIEVTASNLANLTTTGYKAMRVQFADWLSPQTGVAVPPGGRVVAFTQDRATWRDDRTGPLTQTGNPLDLALPGEGYFQVQTPNGTRLTRAGRFNLTAAGGISNDSGHLLLDINNKPMQVPASETDITVTPDGTVRGKRGQIGKIAIMRQAENTKLVPEGSNQFRADGPMTLVTRPKILQGVLEGANVEPVRETTRMIREMREFQYAAQFVQAENDRLQNAIERILRPRTV